MPKPPVIGSQKAKEAWRPRPSIRWPSFRPRLACRSWDYYCCISDGAGISQRQESSAWFISRCSLLTTKTPARMRLFLKLSERTFNAEARSLKISRAAAGAPLRYFLRPPKDCGLPLGSAAYNYCFYLLLTWMPAYLSSELHLDLSHSVFYTSVPWIFATLTDLMVGGWLVDALIQRGWNAVRVRQAVLVGGTGMGLAIVGAARARTANEAVLGISIALAGLSAAAPVGWSMPSLIAPRESVGTIGGISNFCSQIAAIVAPITTGYIVSSTKSFSSAFIAAGIFLAIGIAGYVFLLGNMAPIAEPPLKPF